MHRTVTVSALATACVLSLLASTTLAQSYPTRPIRMVIPWPAGGITDVIARGVNVPLAEALGQPIVIDNRPGAGGTLGAAIVARAGADGHTLLMHDIASHCIAASLYQRLPYDALKDFEP